VGLGRAAAEAAVGSRGKLGLRLAGAGAVGPWRRGSEGVYEFDVPGTEGVYTVRMPLARPGDASCSCADHVRDGFTCKHILAALLTAPRLDPRAVPAPAHLPEGPRSQSASGTGVVSEALRALREAEEEASRLREEVKSSSDENKVLRERLDGLAPAPVAYCSRSRGEASHQRCHARGMAPSDPCLDRSGSISVLYL